MKLYPVRLPEKHIQMIKDIARNKGVKAAEVLREAVAEFLGTYSTIPSLKDLDRQLTTLETRFSQLEKVLMKKGIIE